jgi:hypothetical protein
MRTGPRVHSRTATNVEHASQRLTQQRVELDMYLTLDRDHEAEVDEVELLSCERVCVDRLRAMDRTGVPMLGMARKEVGKFVG